MKRKNTSKMPKKIDVAREVIKELQTMINHWESNEANDFWDIECSRNPS